MDVKSISVLAAAAITLAAASSAAISDSRVVAATIEGMSRQPEAQGSLFRYMLIGIGLVESTPIIALVIAFILLFAKV